MCDYCSARQGDVKQHHDAVHDKIKKFSCDLCEYKGRSRYVNTINNIFWNNNNILCSNIIIRVVINLTLGRKKIVQQSILVYIK